MRTPPTIITFASPKGGVGKSTACLSIAGALTARGDKVHIIDLDHTQTLHRWFTTNQPPIRNLSVEAAEQKDFLVRIKAAYHSMSGFVLIDVAGHFDELMLRAAAIATLTITPSKLNEPDLVEAAKLNRQITELAHTAGKPTLEHRILVNEVLTVLPAHQWQTLDQLRTHPRLRSFATILHNRAAYSEAYLSGRPPHFADQARPAIRKATEELDCLTAEILAITNQSQLLAA